MVKKELRKVGKPKQTREEKAKSGKREYDWRYENSINNKKEYIEVDKQQWKYEPWRTNRVFSNFVETIYIANEMNKAYVVCDQMQYDFYYNMVRKGFRQFPRRKEKNDDFDLIQHYYKYNNERTREALRILSPTQIEIIRKKLDKGGIR
jgi:hypothetical protein